MHFRVWPCEEKNDPEFQITDVKFKNFHGQTAQRWHKSSSRWPWRTYWTEAHSFWVWLFEYVRIIAWGSKVQLGSFQAGSTNFNSPVKMIKNGHLLKCQSIRKSQVQLSQNTAAHFTAAEWRGKGCLTNSHKYRRATRNSIQHDDNVQQYGEGFTRSARVGHPWVYLELVLRALTVPSSSQLNKR